MLYIFLSNFGNQSIHPSFPVPTKRRLVVHTPVLRVIRKIVLI